MSGDSLRFDPVLLDIILPIRRHICVDEDSGDRALGLAKTAVNTLVGMYVDHVVSLVDAINWADGHTRFVFDANARLSDDVGHARYFTGYMASGLVSVGPRTGRLDIPREG